MGFFSWLGDVLTGGAYTSNKTNQEIANQNVALTRETNAQNLAFQKEENEITRAREDNAVRRAALDMQAAGLSKTLAAGSPASAAALSPATMVAPHNDYKAEKLNYLGGVLSIMNGISELRKQNAEVKNIDALTKGINTDNQFKLENHVMDMKLKDSQVKNYESLNKLNYYNSEIARITSEKTAERIDADIRESISRYNVNWSTIALNNSRKEEIAQSITESIARTNKLDQETKNLVRSAIEQRIDILSKLYNMNTYMNVGLPVGGKASMLTQPIYDALMTGGNFISNASKLFGLKTPSNVFDFNIDLTGF